MVDGPIAAVKIQPQIEIILFSAPVTPIQITIDRLIEFIIWLYPSIFNFILMAKLAKNIQAYYSKHPELTTQERSSKPEYVRGKHHDFNFWRFFSKMPRTNSNLPHRDVRDLLTYNQHDKLMVISAFRNVEPPPDSPVKNIKNYKNQSKRYISEQTLQVGRKIQQSNEANEQQVIGTCAQKPEATKNLQAQEGSFSYQLSRSSVISYNKRTVVSGNQSQIKSKCRISKDISRKHNGITTVERIGSKIKLPELKQQKRFPILMRDPQELKEVKSESYIVVQYPTERVIVSHRSVVSLEIASLTKIMTFYTVYCLIEEKGVDIKSQAITVAPEAANISGTSAQIIQGQIYTVQALLYGLLLPSGNDAANQLAFWGGSFLTNSDDFKVKQKAFITQMNRRARLIDLKNSKFANPHGLPHNEARSTAADIAKLCCLCMKIQLFRKIVSSKKYKTVATYQNNVREVQWENTNKLLRRDGFLGLKTGITVTAGPCLAAAYAFRDKTYISVVLRAQKISGRFKETRLLLNWCLSKLYKQLTDEEKGVLKKLKRKDKDLDSDYSEDEHQFNYDSSGAGEYKKRANILNYQL